MKANDRNHYLKIRAKGVEVIASGPLAIRALVLFLVALVAFGLAMGWSQLLTARH